MKMQTLRWFLLKLNFTIVLVYHLVLFYFIYVSPSFLPEETLKQRTK